MILIPKKIRFFLSALFLSTGFIIIQFLPNNLKFIGIFSLVLLVAIFCIWSFYEGLGSNMTMVSLILPMIFTLGVGIFWFLLPSNIYTKIPIVIFYFLGVYVLLSTINIYTVSSSLRSIGLLHAAKGVGFVLTLVTAFLVFDAIFSIKQMFWINFILVYIVSFLIFIQGFWSIGLQKKIDKEMFLLSLISALLMGELVIFIFFWPVSVVVGSLFLTSGVYFLLGLGQAKIEERLFSATVREYLTIGLIVLTTMFISTRWGGE